MSQRKTRTKINPVRNLVGRALNFLQVRIGTSFVVEIVLFNVSFLFLFGCVSSETHQTHNGEIQSFKIFDSKDLYRIEGRPKCKFLLDSYCNYLYSPEVLGNLEIKGVQNSTKVLQGETPNGFSQVYFQYSLAKIRNQKYLPKDFYEILNKNGYFSKLQDFLSRKSRTKMSVQQRLLTERLETEVNLIWSSSINEVILIRMIQKYPKFHQITEKLIPIELSLENRRIRRNLISEVSRAIWRDDKNWKKVEKGFQRLQESFLRVISKLDIPESLQNDWKKRILEVRLVLPGSFPAISNEECSTVTVNAYYYTYLNVLTVCAGDFNSEDIMQTLAHEMGHALGIDRTQYLFQVQSDFGRELSRFRLNICSPQQFSCEDWTKYKMGFESQLGSLNNYKVDLPEFQKCLKRRVTSKSFMEEDVRRFSRIVTSDRISNLASNDRFLRITKSEIPMKNGKFQKNPNYLNPCSYYLWSLGEEPIDDELTTLMYFTAEYRCSEKQKIERMRKAIEVAKVMSIKVIEKTIKIEGEYSSRSLLETEGFSSPNFERFADVIGSYAMADYLSELSSISDRQNKFLASSSWQCLEPSLASHFPDESAIEKEYIFDAHTEGEQRRKELFTEPLREVISCEKDFEFKECLIPFKNKK